MKDFKEPGVVILMYDDQGVWLSERINTKSFIGYWQGAGGGLENHESPFNAALRELGEETAIVVPRSRLTFLGQDLHAKGENDQTFVLYYFVIKLQPGEVPQNTEPEMHGPWKHFTGTEARKLKLMPGLKHSLVKRWIGKA